MHCGGCTVHRGAFCQFFSCGFTTLTVINQPERKLAKRTSVHCALGANVRFKHNNYVAHTMAKLRVIVDKDSYRNRRNTPTLIFELLGFSLHFSKELSYGYLRFEGNMKIPLGRL